MSILENTILGLAFVVLNIYQLRKSSKHSKNMTRIRKIKKAFFMSTTMLEGKCWNHWLDSLQSAGEISREHADSNIYHPLTKPN